MRGAVRGARIPAVQAERRLDQSFLPLAGEEADVVVDGEARRHTAALEVGVSHRVVVAVLVHPEVVVGHVEHEHRRPRRRRGGALGFDAV